MWIYNIKYKISWDLVTRETFVFWCVSLSICHNPCWCNIATKHFETDIFFEASEIMQFELSSLPAIDDFCHLLITQANSLNPDQARHNVGPDLDSKGLTLWYSLLLKIFL